MMEANTAFALRTGALPTNMAHARKKARDALSPAVKEKLRKHLEDSYGACAAQGDHQEQHPLDDHRAGAA